MSSVVPLRSSSCQSPDLVLSRPFPSVLTTMAFDHSHRRWFGACSCKPVPRGLPSSIKQLHTLGPPLPFALVAHSHPRSGLSPSPQTRFACSITSPIGRVRNEGRCALKAARSPPLAASPPSSPTPPHHPILPLSTISGSAAASLDLPRVSGAIAADAHGL